MSIYTGRQKTASEDFLGANCVLFFPFNEGSGTTFTDLVKGVTISDASATHNKPYVVNQVYTNIAPVTGEISKIPIGKSVIAFNCYNVVTNAALASFSYGHAVSGDGGLALNNQSARLVNDISGSGIITDTTGVPQAGVGDTDFIAATIDVGNQTLSYFKAVNTAAIVKYDEIDASAELTGSYSLNSNGVITIGNSVAGRSGYYGTCLLAVDSLPTDADLIDFLTYTRTQLTSGRKVIDPRLKNY